MSSNFNNSNNLYIPTLDSDDFLSQTENDLEELSIWEKAEFNNKSINPDNAAKLAAEEDKRRRNTAASARFRVKKKLREQVLERSAKEMALKVELYEGKIKELELENKWLRSLIVEKDARLLDVGPADKKQKLDDNMSDKRHYTFLLVSDIHYHLEDIKKLKQWLLKRDRLKELINELRNLDKPLLYIPGNHDPDTSFTQSKDQDNGGNNDDKKCKNMHNQTMQLEPGLSIVGFGGSTNGVLKNSPGTVVWPAYPKDSESLFTKNLPNLLNKVKDDDIILVTHVGPADVGTTNVDKFPLQSSLAISSGSLALHDFIMSSSPSSETNSSSLKHDIRIINNIHGHSHWSFGLSHIGQTAIINPGAFEDGRFAILSMVKLRKDELIARDIERKVYYESSAKNQFWVIAGLEMLVLL
ncbi:11222_t:CDS:2 [Entrophospora sp. SA101]|nr:11222_t:CDS:2 [Entrophospora sp. SA101]